MLGKGCTTEMHAGGGGDLNDVSDKLWKSATP